VSTNAKISFVLMAALAATVCAAAADRGFEGKWVLDKHASNTGTIPPPEDLRQNIKKSGNELIIESTFKEPNNAIAPLLYLGIMTTALRMAADGSESVAQVGPYMQTCKTTVDGNKMTTQWVAKHTSGEVVTGQWVRTLDPDGKHMTLDIQENSTKGQGGTASLHFVRK
jgi:hypothetical protein